MSEETKKAWEQARLDSIKHNKDSERYNGGAAYFLIDDGDTDALRLRLLETDRELDLEGHRDVEVIHSIKSSTKNDTENRVIAAIDEKYALKKARKKVTNEAASTNPNRVD